MSAEKLKKYETALRIIAGELQCDSLMSNQDVAREALKSLPTENTECNPARRIDGSIDPYLA
jgi:hypothetical protein